MDRAAHHLPSANESALALLIQEGQALDPPISAKIAAEYAPGVHRFILELVRVQNRQLEEPRDKNVRELVQNTFATALHDPGSFLGRANVRAWLYTHAIRQVRTLPKSRSSQRETIRPLAGSPDTPNFYALPQKVRLPLVLRYGHQLPLEEIVILLRTTEHKIHEQLVEARVRLLNLKSHNPGLVLANPNLHESRAIHRRLDGLLDPSAEQALQNHLDQCPACDAYLQRLMRLEEELIAELHIQTPYLEEDVHAIVRAVTERETKPNLTGWSSRLGGLKFSLREIMWVVLAAGIFLTLAWWLNPFFTSPGAATPPKTPTPTLPPAESITTVFRQDAPESKPDIQQHVIWSLTAVQTGAHIPTTPMTFSPFGDAVAFGSSNNVILWDLNLRSQLIFDGHSSVVTALEFSPTGEFLATGDENGTVYVWDTFNGQRIFWLVNHPGSIHSLAYSQAGNSLAVGFDEGIWLWKITEHAAFRSKEIAWNWIHRVALSPDGQWLAAADRNNTIALWNAEDGNFLLRFQTLGTSGTSRLTFAPGGNLLASSSISGMVEVVALRARTDGQVLGTRLLALQHPAWVSEVVWAPDGKKIATISDTKIQSGLDISNRAVYLWDIETGTLDHAPLTAQIARGLSRAAFSPSGSELIVSNFEGSLFRWVLEDVSSLVSSTPEPNYYLRAETNTLEGNWITENENTISFTNTQTLNGIQIIALFPVPPQYTFLNGTYTPDEQRIRLNYQSLSGNIVTITQRPASGLASPQPGDFIGASAVVHPEQIHGTIGEFVTGSWILASPDNPDWPEQINPVYRWQPHGELRLRWEQQGYLLEIKTYVNQLNPQNLSKNELVRLALNLAAQAERPILLAYTVQEGNTCSGIAQRYGTNVDQIANANGLGNCDLIRAGQTLLIPLSRDRELIAQADLNCDGKIEQIWAIPDPLRESLAKNFGIILQAVPPGGTQHWPVWRLTIADVPVDHFGIPDILFSYSGCEKFLAVHMFDETGQSLGLELYRWDGEQLFLALSTKGSIKTVFSSGSGTAAKFMLTVQDHDRIPDTSRCNRITTTFEWNGSFFIQGERMEEANVSCFDR